MVTAHNEKERTHAVLTHEKLNEQQQQKRE